jgi:hypothetical protein
MTIQQQIDNAREHLRGSKWKVRPSGEPITAEDIELEVYSYKALMSAAIRAALSSRALNQFHKALKEDGFIVLDNNKAPVAGDIATDGFISYQQLQKEA